MLSKELVGKWNDLGYTMKENSDEFQFRYCSNITLKFSKKVPKSLFIEIKDKNSIDNITLIFKIIELELITKTLNYIEKQITDDVEVLSESMLLAIRRSISQLDCNNTIDGMSNINILYQSYVDLKNELAKRGRNER